MLSKTYQNIYKEKQQPKQNIINLKDIYILNISLVINY